METMCYTKRWWFLYILSVAFSERVLQNDPRPPCPVKGLPSQQQHKFPINISLNNKGRGFIAKHPEGQGLIGLCDTCFLGFGEGFARLWGQMGSKRVPNQKSRISSHDDTSNITSQPMGCILWISGFIVYGI